MTAPRIFTTLILSAVTLLPCRAMAASYVGALALSSSKMFQTSVDSGTYLCGKVSSKWVPGSKVSSKKLFWPYSAQITAMKKKIAVAKGSTKSSLSKQLSSMNKKYKLGKPVCAAGKPGGSSGGGSGGGTGGPTFCFDSAGNVTAAGKTAFQIPSSYTANVDVGFSIYQSYCVGCHTEHPQPFPVLRAAIAQDPMYFTASQIPDPVLANLVAYLMRYNAVCG